MARLIATIRNQVTLTTPFGRFKYGLVPGSVGKPSVWTDITYTLARTTDRFYTVQTVCSDPSFRQLIESPIRFSGVELPRGVVIVLGGPTVGKTLWMEEMIPTLDRGTTGLTIATFIEPIEARRMSFYVPDLEYDTLLPYLAQFIVGANGNEEVMFLDSLSPFLFMEWPGWNTAKFAINSGAGFWCTTLHNALIKWGRTLITSVNPYATKADIVEAFEMFMKGRVAGVFVLTGDRQGTYMYRASTGERLSVPISNLLSESSSDHDTSDEKSNVTPRIINSVDDLYLQ